MGATKCKRCDCGQYTFGGPIYWKPEEMKYGSNWGWIMPVVEKIEGLGYIVVIAKDRCQIGLPDDINPKVSWCTKTKLEAIYQAVVEFINYYNGN